MSYCGSNAPPNYGDDPEHRDLYQKTSDPIGTGQPSEEHSRLVRHGASKTAQVMGRATLSGLGRGALRVRKYLSG